MKIEVIENGISYFAPEVFGTISAFKNPEVYLDGKLMPSPDPVRALRSLMCSYFYHNGGNPSMSEKDIETYYEDRYLQQSPYRSESPVNPSHHKGFDSQNRQWLENWLLSPGLDTQEIRGALMVLADKYIDRCGRKDSQEQEVAKALWYHRFAVLLTGGETSGTSIRGLADEELLEATSRILHALDCVTLSTVQMKIGACIALHRMHRRDELFALVITATLLQLMRDGTLPADVEQVHKISESI